MEALEDIYLITKMFKHTEEGKTSSLQKNLEKTAREVELEQQPVIAKTKVKEQNN